jgi:hypothetical protein
MLYVRYDRRLARLSGSRQVPLARTVHPVRGCLCPVRGDVRNRCVCSWAHIHGSAIRVEVADLEPTRVSSNEVAARESSSTPQPDLNYHTQSPINSTCPFNSFGVVWHCSWEEVRHLARLPISRRSGESM